MNIKKRTLGLCMTGALVAGAAGGYFYNEFPRAIKDNIAEVREEAIDCCRAKKCSNKDMEIHVESTVEKTKEKYRTLKTMRGSNVTKMSDHEPIKKEALEHHACLHCVDEIKKGL